MGNIVETQVLEIAKVAEQYATLSSKSQVIDPFVIKFEIQLSSSNLIYRMMMSVARRLHYTRFVHKRKRLKIVCTN